MAASPITGCTARTNCLVSLALCEVIVAVSVTITAESSGCVTIPPTEITAGVSDAHVTVQLSRPLAGNVTFCVTLAAESPAA